MRRIVLAGLVGAGIGLGLAPALPRISDLGVPPWTAAAVLMAGVLLPLPLHELGHVVAGLTHGMRLDLLTIGPLCLVRRGGRLRVTRTPSLMMWGGLTGMAPPLTDDLPRRMAAYYAGGPLASAATVAMGALLGTLAGERHGALTLLGWTLAASGAMVLLAVTLPSSTGGLPTDRARLQGLRGGGSRAQVSAALAAVMAHDAAGVRPADWPRELVERIREHLDDSPEARLAQAVVLPMERYDRGEHEGALADMEEAWEKELLGPGLLRSFLALEIACLRTRLHGDVEGARAFVEAASSGRRLPAFLRAPVEVSLLEAEGAPAEEVRAARAAALRWYRHQPPSGTVAAKIAELERDAARSADAFGISGR